jgi:hypothetical protein
MIDLANRLEACHGFAGGVCGESEMIDLAMSRTRRVIMGKTKLEVNEQ